MNSKARHRRSLSTAALILSHTFSVVFACLAASQALANQPPVQVEVMQVSAQKVPLKIELPTVLYGSKEVEIRARVAGKIVSINFKDGDSVEQGQSLFILDSADSEASLARLKADQVALQARLDQANRDVSRLTQLKSQRAIAQKDVDDALSAKAIAAADILAGEARVKEAQLNIEYAQVKAPVSGTLSSAMVSVGDYVQGAADILVELTQIDPIYARFSLPTRAYQAIQAEAATGALILPKQSNWHARLKFGFDQFYGEEGQVDFIDVRVDPTTGAQRGRAVFPNETGVLNPGQYLRIFVEGAYRPDAIAVPQSAVLDNAQGKFVYRYIKEDNHYLAQPQPVTLGEWVVIKDKNYWVIRKGLVTDDQIIVSGHARIFAPMTVVKALGPLQVQGKDGQLLQEQSI